MSYTSWISFRYLISKKKHAFISIITFISIVGVALGVMALTVVLSVVSGFEEDFQRKILGNNAPLIVFSSMGPFAQDEEMEKRIRNVQGVTGVSPFLYNEVLLQSSSGRSAGVMVYGVEPEKIGEVTSLKQDMVVGSLENLKREKGNLPGILIGSTLAESTLFTFPGSTLDAVSPTGEITPFGFGPKVRRFEIVGTFKSGLYEYDTKSAYILLKDAQRLFGRNEISGLQINVRDTKDAFKLREEVQAVLGPKYYVRHWLELNQDLFNAFRLEKTTFFIILTMIVLVASFNIIGTLTLLVMMKGKEIAILKAMGATKIDIAKIFMLCGSAIGFIGMIVGVTLGYTLCVLLKEYIRFPLNADVYQIDTLPVNMHWEEFLLVAVCALLISFAATLYPSIRAASMHPAEGLRNE